VTNQANVKGSTNVAMGIGNTADMASVDIK